MGKLELHTVEVHIWKLRWRELETFWNRYKPILEKEECQKAKHYRFHEDKMRYLAGKIAVRMFLKEYSGEDKIVLRQGKYGKLYWKAPPGQRKITFNLSHSGEWVLAIFASRQAVGIDVQEMGEISEYMEIAKNFFTEEEAAEIQETESPERFYQYWAAREAHLKALGIGLNKGMDFFSVRENKIIEKGKIKSGCSIAGMVSNEVIEKSLLLTSSNPSRLTGSVAAATVLTILEMGMERGSFLLSKSKINLEVMKKLLNIGTEIRVSIRDNIGSDEIEGEI